MPDQLQCERYEVIFCLYGRINLTGVSTARAMTQQKKEFASYLYYKTTQNRNAYILPLKQNILYKWEFYVTFSF